MNLKYLSWEAEGLLCLGDGRVQPRYYQRIDGPLRANPDIAFVGDKAHWLPLRNAETFPDEMFVKEESGDVFKYLAL